MPIDDMWHLKTLGPDGKRRRSKLYGKGKRWRVRYPGGSKYFRRETDAKDFDAEQRLGIPSEAPSQRRVGTVTFREYGERWRLAREVGWAVETRRRVEANLRLHLYPAFGNRKVTTITPTVILEWVSGRLAEATPKSSMRLYFELLDTVLAASVVDKIAPENACDGIKLGQILRGLSRAPKWIPTEEEVLTLFDAVPKRYQALLWLGAGQGLRIGEALGIEEGPRCVEPAHQELHVVQQLRYSPKAFGGFYLSEPKSRSSGTVDLDPVVAGALADHVAAFPPVNIELVDTTGADPITRVAPLLFTTTRGNPFTDRTWSNEWVKWRDQAGWPKEHGGFHALRHFFATTLITNNVEPKEVQRALRHSSLQTTLETYVHWWPRRERQRGVVGALLQSAAERH
jgi:integrase